MDYKNLTFEIKALDGDGRTLEGFCAAFGNIDQVGDIIHPGAFRKTLTERGGRIKFLWQHDPTEPIGRLVEAREDTSGLYVKAVISDTARGRDAIALLRDGAIGEMSIGYDAVKGGTDYSKTPEGKSVRNLREIKLYEFSLVTFPANEQAVVTALKQQDITPAEGKPYVIAKRGDKWGVYKEDADGNPTGDALGMHDSEESAKEQLRALYANEDKSHPPETDADEGDEGEPDAEPEIKAGRTISRATAAELRAARDVLDRLIQMAETSEPEEEPAPTKAAEEQEHKAGPVSPPTSSERLLKLIELELTTLEV